MKILTLKAEVPSTRQIILTLPEGVPVGPVDLEIHITSPTSSLPVPGTLGSLLSSPLCGIWADRTDIEDSIIYARQLRSQAEQRQHG